MSLKFEVEYRKLDFIHDAETSRGILKHKKIWFIKAYDTLLPTVFGIGESGPLQKMSIDDINNFEDTLKMELSKIEGSLLPNNFKEIIALIGTISPKFPSICFGLEMALLDLIYGGKRKYFDNDFFDLGKPIQINGLVWMGSSSVMLQRLEEKINQGFRCIKIKIGAIALEEEMKLLENIRSRFTSSKVELRVDANGAFTFDQAKQVLDRLKALDVHSIEQPIKAGKHKLMAELCSKTPVSIALDEELIGIYSYLQKKELLEKIKPHYIILKPALLGGFNATLMWIKIAETLKIGWWITSSLESNLGLNAICQFASSLHPYLPQGLGTGGLYKNNIDSPLALTRDYIQYDKKKKWGGL